MSTKSLARSHDEIVWDTVLEYRRRFGDEFRFEDVTKWIRKNRLLPDPKSNPERLMTRMLKQTARRRRCRDPQDRIVREILARKVPRVDAHGNKYFEVVWAFLNDMSLDFALAACKAREENIGKQQRAAANDVESMLDNNPNVCGHRERFLQFAFMHEMPAPVIEETISETPLESPAIGVNAMVEDVGLSRKKPR